MKYLFCFFLSFFAWILHGQNLQLYYDFGKAYNGPDQIVRRFLTATFEFYKPDSLGSTFLFIDVDFDKDNGGASMAYFEISRKFTLDKKSGLSFHVEINDGTPYYIQRALLTGLSYPIKIGKVTIHTAVLLRGALGGRSPDGQITLTWYQTFFKSKFLFCGFLDIWTQDHSSSPGKMIVFLTEPQIWYVFSKHFSVGSEIEISRNFFTFDNTFEVMPTIGVKWIF